MYVIKDKKGRFYNGTGARGLWTRDIEKATVYDNKSGALKACFKEAGERVFEVKLVLGKQVN